MALTSGFYPSRDGDRKYSSEQFGALFDGIITDGIIGNYGGKMMVEPKSGNTILIRSGRAWFNHTWVLNDTNYTLSLDPAEVLLPRYDAIVLKIDRSTSVRRASFKAVKGTPASKPQYPKVGQYEDGGLVGVNPIGVSGSSSSSSSTVTEIVIACVLRRAGSSEIRAADIDNGLAPYASGVMKTLDVNSLLIKWNDKFDMNVKNWTNSFNALYSNWDNSLSELSDVWANNFEALANNWERDFSQISSNWTENFEWMAGHYTEEFESLHDVWKESFETLYDTHNARLQSLVNEFEVLISNSTNTFDAFMVRIDEAFDAFEAQKQEEIDEMLANLGNEFTVFWTDFKALMNEYLTGQEGIWERWFSHIQGQLDEDAAGHLQSQIDALTYIYVYDNELIFPGTAASVGDHELILSNPAITTPIPAFGVDPGTGHLNYTSNQTFNVDDTSGHIQWDFT